MASVTTEEPIVEEFDATTEKAKAIEAVVLAGRMQGSQNGRYVRDFVNAKFKNNIDAVEAVKVLISEIQQYGRIMVLALEQASTRFDLNESEANRLGIPDDLKPRTDKIVNHLLCRVGSKDVAQSFTQATKGMSVAYIVERLCKE